MTSPVPRRNSIGWEAVPTQEVATTALIAIVSLRGVATLVELERWRDEAS